MGTIKIHSPFVPPRNPQNRAKVTRQLVDVTDWKHKVGDFFWQLEHFIYDNKYVFIWLAQIILFQAILCIPIHGQPIGKILLDKIHFFEIKPFQFPGVEMWLAFLTLEVFVIVVTTITTQCAKMIERLCQPNSARQSQQSPVGRSVQSVAQSPSQDDCHAQCGPVENCLYNSDSDEPPSKEENKASYRHSIIGISERDSILGLISSDNEGTSAPPSRPPSRHGHL